MNLTKNEVEVMDVLWKVDKALSRAELINESVDRTWKESSIHVLLNSLLRKGAICEAGFVKNGKAIGRTYAAAVTCEQYHALAAAENTKMKPQLPQLFEALLKEFKPDKATLEELQTILDGAKKVKK